jgi:hypothetical protein
MNFNFIFLGQSILRYEVPLDIFTGINQIYEEKFNQLHPANRQLVGKIKDEHSLFYDGDDESKMKRHNLFPKNVLDWWINEMKANEYNPVHIHQGNIFTGLSSVMVLKLPNTYGVEYSASDTPQNGRLQILGASSGQFAKVDYQPPMKLRDFYIFPYDMRHCVYPFNGTQDTRRTLAANCDVLFNPIINRGA